MPYSVKQTRQGYGVWNMERKNGSHTIQPNLKPNRNINYQIMLVILKVKFLKNELPIFIHI